ncbi:MAG: hypothetical protein R3F49_03040 [Planctomycetota bacterium]
MTGDSPRFARFVALDVAASATRGSRFEPRGLARRAALLLTLAPPRAGRHERLTDGTADGTADDSADETAEGHAYEAPEDLVARWRAAAAGLRQREAAPRGAGRLLAAALGFVVDVRATEFADALEECLRRCREVGVRGSAKRRWVEAALLVCEGATDGSGIVPTFARVRALAATPRPPRAPRGHRAGVAEELAATLVGADALGPRPAPRALLSLAAPIARGAL